MDWRVCLLKSRRHPANWRWHLWIVCMDLTPVGGHLSPVDAASTPDAAASTVVATTPLNVNTPSSTVETARLNVEIRMTEPDFNPSVAQFSLAIVNLAAPGCA